MGIAGLAPPAPGRFSLALEQAPLALVLALPLLLLHATSAGEIAIALITAAFLARCWSLGDWKWVRRGWAPLGLAWWLWLVVCSVPGIGQGGFASLGQAIVSARYLLFVAALEHAVLASPRARRWMWWSLAASCAYYAAQVAVQFATGRNLFGVPKNIDGVLTDPFGKVRIGAPLSRIFWPVILPISAALLRRRAWSATTGALALVVGAVGLMVVIGQRMPLVLAAFGLAVASLLIRRLRPIAIVALLSGAALVSATAVIAPPVFYRLVTRFSDQIEHFQSSDYGMLTARALSMAEQHPVHGRGFNGFRTGCADPRYLTGPIEAGAKDPGCNIHPHSHYLQALTDSGVPGLVLWSALVVTWLGILGRGLWRDPDPLRAGLFVAVLIDQWPIASTSSMFAVEIEGFFFLLLGWGLAASAAYRAERASATSP